MKRILGLVILLLVPARPSFASGAASVAAEYSAGRPLAIVNVIDENGVVSSNAKWKGAPLILVPIYTRCPLACPTITRGMLKAVANAKASPTSYRVVMFSFDKNDTPADLRRFRERHHLPLAWSVVTAKENDIRTMLDSVGYTFRSANGLFDHPNLAIAFDKQLKTAKYLPGTTYDIDDALRVANGGTDWVVRYGAYILAALLLTCIFSAVYLFVLLTRMKTASA